NTKTRIHGEAEIRSIITYTARTRPETSKTRRLLETTEMKILRRMSTSRSRTKTSVEWQRI
ncbi:unnamed protein product, partial [Diabrotica balteata]